MTALCEGRQEPDQQVLSELAAAALDLWLPIVGVLPSIARDKGRVTDLRHLVVWYEVVGNGSGSVEPPPLEGLDALVFELMAARSANELEQLRCARWAVRVAEDLVRLRRIQDRSMSPAGSEVVISRLELSLSAARRVIDGRVGRQHGSTLRD